MEPGGQILSAKWRLLRGYRVRAGADGLSEGFGATISNVADTFFFFFSSRRRHTRSLCDWSSDVCSSDLPLRGSGSCEIGGARTGAGWPRLHTDRLQERQWRDAHRAVEHPRSGPRLVGGKYAGLVCRLERTRRLSRTDPFLPRARSAGLRVVTASGPGRNRKRSIWSPLRTINEEVGRFSRGCARLPTNLF